MQSYNYVINLHIMSRQRGKWQLKDRSADSFIDWPLAPNKHRSVISPHRAAATPCNQKPSTTNKTVLWALIQTSSSIYCYAYSSLDLKWYMSNTVLSRKPAVTMCSVITLFSVRCPWLFFLYLSSQCGCWAACLSHIIYRV